jgi:hypothetical protein
VNLETMAHELIGRVLEGGLRGEQHRRGNFGVLVQREFMARLGFVQGRRFTIVVVRASGVHLDRRVCVTVDGWHLLTVSGTRAMAAVVLAADGATGDHAAEVMALATLIHQADRVHPATG